MRTAKMWKDSLNGWNFKTPYSLEFVTELKGSIPPLGRLWEPSEKVWWVDEEYIDVAKEIARKYYILFEVEAPKEENRTPPPRQDYFGTSSKGPHAVLHLLPSAPPELIKAAYRALALLHHPDHGGDTSTMQAINSAYETLTMGNKR